MPIKKDRPTLKLGSSTDLKLGDNVTSIGQPLNFRWTVVSGKISHLGVNPNCNRTTKAPQLILYDGSVNEGVSGGPLLNHKGEVVAMSVQMIDVGGAVLFGAGSTLGLALPVEDIRYVLPKLKAGGEIKHPPIRMKFDREDRMLDWEFEQLQIRRPSIVGGLAIFRLNDDSAEKEAGLKIGDVIVSCDGKKPKSVCDLYRQIYFRHDFNEEMKLLIDRYGQQQIIKLKFKP